MNKMPDNKVISGKIEQLGSYIHYWLHGTVEKPLIVFTHGATLDHTIFDLQIPALISEGYSVLTWDMRGHGKSKPLGEKFNVRVAADDLIAILDRIEKLQQ